MKSNVDIDRLIEWLGPSGAVAGLDSSDITAADLYEIAGQRGLNLEKKSSRHDLVCDIVNANKRLITENPQELTELSRSELEEIIRSRNVSATELKEVLDGFDIKSRRLTRSKLIDFFVNEIADIGMYQRVSRGKARRSDG